NAQRAFAPLSIQNLGRSNRGWKPPSPALAGLSRAGDPGAVTTRAATVTMTSTRCIACMGVSPAAAERRSHVAARPAPGRHAHPGHALLPAGEGAGCGARVYSWLRERARL